MAVARYSRAHTARGPHWGLMGIKLGLTLTPHSHRGLLALGTCTRNQGWDRWNLASGPLTCVVPLSPLLHLSMLPFPQSSTSTCQYVLQPTATWPSFLWDTLVLWTCCLLGQLARPLLANPGHSPGHPVWTVRVHTVQQQAWRRPWVCALLLPMVRQGPRPFSRGLLRTSPWEVSHLPASHCGSLFSAEGFKEEHDNCICRLLR